MDTVGSSANAAVPHRRARAPQGCKAAKSSIGVHRILPESCIAGFRSAFRECPAVLMLLLCHFKRDVAVGDVRKGWVGSGSLIAVARRSGFGASRPLPCV